MDQKLPLVLKFTSPGEKRGNCNHSLRVILIWATFQCPRINNKKISF